MPGLEISEMKKIAYDVIDSERKKHNLDIDVFPITFFEYYNSYMKHKNYSLSRKAIASIMPMVAGGFYDDINSDVVVFLKSVNKFQKMERKLFNLLMICFHEVRHSEQKKFDPYSYNGFCSSIDDFMRLVTFDLDYSLEHDNFFNEIDANLIGVKKAKKYLLKNYPDYYKKNIEYINYLERKYKYDYLMYDTSYNIDRYLSLRKKATTVKNSINLDVVLPKMNNVSPVLEIFLNDDHSFKNLKDIINNEKYKLLDKKIIYSFFSSHSFLESVNLDKLSEEEIKIIREALNYTHNLYLKQEKHTDEALKFNVISNIQNLKNKTTILEKINFITHYYKLKYKRFINPSRSETDRVKHIKEVQNYFKTYDQAKVESEELDNLNNEKNQSLADKVVQARKEWKNNLSSYELYSKYKNVIKEKLENEKKENGNEQAVINDYEEKKQLYEELSFSKNLVEQIHAKTTEEIDTDLDKFEEQERKILNSKHFSEEQKKEMINNLYSEFDEYIDQNLDLSQRRM